MTARAIIEATRLEEALGDENQAAEVFWACLDALGTTLQADDRRALSGALPSSIVDRMLACRFEPGTKETAVVAQVAQATGLTPGRALEVVQVVARSLAVSLPEGLRARLERHAGEDLAQLWSRPAQPPPPDKPIHHAPPGHGHTLASGRPGSRHPLSESGPIGHVDSIAANPDPRGDRKLSSAPGATTAEREGRTIAEGRPGSHRPLSEGGDE